MGDLPDAGGRVTTLNPKAIRHRAIRRGNLPVHLFGAPFRRTFVPSFSCAWTASREKAGFDTIRTKPGWVMGQVAQSLA